MNIAIHEGELLAAAPADESNLERHVAAVHLLDAQRALLRVAAATLAD